MWQERLAALSRERMANASRSRPHPRPAHPSREGRNGKARTKKKTGTMSSPSGQGGGESAETGSRGGVDVVVVVGVRDGVGYRFADKTLRSLLLQGYARWRAAVVVSEPSQGRDQLARLHAALSPALNQTFRQDHHKLSHLI